MSGSDEALMRHLGFLDGLEPFELPFSEPAVALACGRVDDHARELLAAERTGLDRMGDVRRREYSSGRRVARQALELLGIRDEAVTTHGRMPVWPSGIAGSITHSRMLALAMVARKRDVAGIGVDLEVELRVTEQLSRRVLLDRERERPVDADWRTMLFAAKEAVYKAVNPLVGEYLEFGDVEISASGAGGFRAATTRLRESTTVMQTGKGYFRRVEGHWLCVFLVPAAGFEADQS
ncbi:MAG: 4'-phosphopantetheinyl transferase superfamily protein [Gammaproteobacteria bacterium]|nr:4'-phosphopantetheinyl transferase superfamily protein [Gammaproteobacteria bacterium]